MYSSVNCADAANAVSTSGHRCVVKCRTPRMYAQISSDPESSGMVARSFASSSRAISASS